MLIVLTPIASDAADELTTVASRAADELTPDNVRQRLPGIPQPIDVSRFHDFDRSKAVVGNLLFHDKLLSGNRNIACNTCHHDRFGSADGVSLGIGEGGHGVGPQRTPGTGAARIAKRIPRNAPGLWNLGHKEVHTLFYDGRLSVSELYGNGFNSPAEEWLPEGFSHLLAAQSVFPLVAQFEMAGNSGENEVAGAIHDRIDAAWPIISQRVSSNAIYAQAFIDAFDTIDHPADIDIVAIGEALGAFMGLQWQSIDSPFDRWLGGDPTALSADALQGLQLFYGKADCVSCHSGALFTDQAFHALALPPFGPGRTRLYDPMPRDTGRLAESDRLEDAYRFRTPSLRNVTLTAPYGHNGAYPTLEGIVRHHLDPVDSREQWQPSMAALPTIPWLTEVDFIITTDRHEMRRFERALDINLPRLSSGEIRQVLSFLHALTGESVLQRPFVKPAEVPSGLPLD
jgi:cytochrome c peroxidase